MSDYRRTKGGDFNINLGASFPATVFDQIEFLAQSRGMPKARVLRELTLRGLAAYHRDGRLCETTDSASVVVGMTAVNPTELTCEAKMSS